MKYKEIFKKDDLHVLLNSDKKIIKFVCLPADRVMTVEDYKKQIDKHFKDYKMHSIEFMILDAKYASFDEVPYLGDWKKKEIIPEYLKTNLTRIAYILPDATLENLPFELLITPVSDTPPDSNHFRKEATAIEWLEDLEYMEKDKATKEGIERYNEGMREEGRIEGRREGRIEGRIEGRRKGRIEGIKQVVEQGIEQEKKRNENITQQAELQRQEAELTVTIIQLYYKDNKSIDEIVDITKRSEEYIKKILE